MTAKAPNYFGIGIYDVPEAARLSGVSAQRIRRWLKGYRFQSTYGPSESPPVWQSSLPVMDGKLALTFLDLMEVRFVDAFLHQGVSWKTIRLAADRARMLFKTNHPFSIKSFRTDGRCIFTQIREETDEPELIDVATSQQAFQRILAPYLTGIEFDHTNRAARWWPLGKAKGIVLDPHRSFGQPIIARFGIPTYVLAAAFKAEGSWERVAKWYGVDQRSIRDATAFERKLAA